MDDKEDMEQKAWLLTRNSHNNPTMMHNNAVGSNNQKALQEKKISEIYIFL